MALGPFTALMLGVLNMGLLVALLVLFFQQWRKMRSPFTAGLLLFAVAFLLQDLLRLATLVGRHTRTFIPVRDLDFAVELLQLVAVGTLLYVVTR